ncbi:ABC transporter permease [bacterium]|nr:MAG: ABC transporter permease [bacterium]
MDLKRRLGLIKEKYLPSLVFIILLVLLWEFLVRLFSLPEYILPSPLMIARTFLKFRKILLFHTSVTVFETLSGFMVGAILGFILAVFICMSDFFYRTFYPVLIVIQSIPKVALAPFFIIWMGFGILPKIAITVLVSIFPVLVNTLHGLVFVKQELIDLMKVFHASKIQVLFKIRIPSSLPFFFTSLKISIIFSVVGAIIGEFVGANKGLGYVIMISSSNLNTSLMFAALFLLGAIGVFCSLLVSLSEKMLLPWHKEAKDA